MIKTDSEITELVDKNTNSYNDVFHGFKKLEERLHVIRYMEIHSYKPKPNF